MAGEEAAPHEKAGSEAGQLLEAKLETPEEAALGEPHLPENVVLPKGENGDEVCPGNREWGDSAQPLPCAPSGVLRLGLSQPGEETSSSNR